MAGLIWQEVAQHTGLAQSSSVHGVADGADVIFHTFTDQFGVWDQKAKFTVDYYHVNEHLGQAAEAIAPSAKTAWLHEQHGRLLQTKSRKFSNA